MKINALLGRYSFALLSAGLAFVLTDWTIPIIKSDAFDFFQGAVFLSAWYGGLGPGLLAAGVSIAALDYFFIPPYSGLSVQMPDLLRLGIFGVVAVITSSLSARLQRVNSELETAHRDLEDRIRQRTHELSVANERLQREIQQRSEAERAIMEISNREQRRLGQDLHDGLNQILAGVKLMTERIKREVAPISASVSEKLGVIEARLGDALTQADAVSRGLFPVELETNGLMAALGEMTLKTSRAFDVNCILKFRTPVSISDSALANHVYRIAQEAVTNAIKSGKATRIHVRVRGGPGKTSLSVADNGIGFGNQPSRKGMGLRLMEYRSRFIGGSLSIRSRRTGGTVVRCTFPAPTEERHDS